MSFSSLNFILRFLPVFLAVYYLTPRKWKNITLAVGSMVFYALGDLWALPVLLISILLNHILARAMARAKKRGFAAFLLVVDITINLAVLLFYKYTGFIIANLNLAAGTEIVFPTPAMPLGISFYTFQILSYVIDVYRGRIPYERSLIDLTDYIMMFPQLTAGPVVRYEEVALDLKSRRINLSNIEEGLPAFILGLSMKALLANNLSSIWLNVGTAGYENISTILAWIGALSYTFEIYFDFAGYSLMAIGLGRMLGFRIPVNFDHPYISRSVREFWERWHMTLTSWFRDYIYIPLGGNRKGRIRTVINLLIVWTVTGLWHGASWNFVLWGLYYFCFIFIERLFLSKLLKHLPVIRWIYTMLVVVIGWLLFAIPEVDQFAVYITRLFEYHPGTDYMENLTGMAILLISGAFFSLPLFEKFVMRHRRDVMGIGILAVLFWASISALVDAAYDPFLYFRF